MVATWRIGHNKIWYVFSELDFLKVLRFSYPIPAVGPSEKKIELDQKSISDSSCASIILFRPNS